jgi:hypothetical protein
MIKDKVIAESVSKLMLEFGGRLDASMVAVQDNCSEAEFHAYRLAVGKILGDMLLEVMNPLYQQHPDLKPSGLNDRARQSAEPKGGFEVPTAATHR